MNHHKRLAKCWKWILGGAIVSVCILLYLAASRTMLLPAFFRMPAPPAPQANTRDERWRQDVRYLASQLPRLHIDAFHAIQRESFERTVADLDAAIPRLTDQEIVLEIVRVVAMVGDAHTGCATVSYVLQPVPAQTALAA